MEVDQWRRLSAVVGDTEIGAGLEEEADDGSGPRLILVCAGNMECCFATGNL